MTGFERFRKHWLWALVAFLVTTIIALASAYFQYRSTQHDLGGSLNATFHSRLLNNREARTIVVCMEDTTISLTNLYVTPTFDNPAEYSLKDFSLSFDAECTNVHIIPTSFVDAHEYEKNEWIYKYKDNVLAAHDDTKKPFSHFVLSDTKGRCYIKTKASYDGAADAFKYNTDVWFIVEPNKKHLSFEDWKINCKKRIFEVIEDKFYDVYYYTHDNQPEYQFDVALGASDNNSSNQMTKAEQKSSIKQQEQTSKSTETSKPEKPTVENKTKETVEPQKPQEDKTLRKSGVLNISNYYVQQQSTSNTLIVNLDNSLASGTEYLLLFEDRDSINNNYTMYSYVSTYNKTSENQITFDYSKNITLTNISNLKLLENSKVDDFIKIDSTSGYDFENITDYHIVCLIRYSGNSRTYRNLRGGEKIHLEDIGSEPLLVFNTGEIKKKDVSFETTGFSMSIWEFIIMTISFIGGSFIMVIIMIAVDSFFDNGGSFDTVKSEFEGFSYSGLIEECKDNKNSLQTKMWLLFLCLSIHIAPLYLLYLLFIK